MIVQQVCHRMGVAIVLSLLIACQVQAQFIEEDKLTPSDAGLFAAFGNNISMHGDRLLVGADGDDEDGSRAGAAYIFERQANGTWQEVAKLTASDGGPDNNFGNSVSLDEDRLLIGAIGNDDVGGRPASAYVFERQPNGTWQEVANLVPSDGTDPGGFGGSVSISGDRLVVGATGDNERGNRAGAAYVFERQGDGSWREVAKLTASDAVAGDLFGRVSMNDDRIAVGAFRSGGLNSGAVYVFERQSDGTWREVAKLTASDGTRSNGFGGQVSLSGNRLLAGAFRSFESFLTRAAYVFERQGNGSWREVAKLTAPDGALQDRFGTSVALSGDRLAVGASGDTTNGPTSGAVYTFAPSTTDPVVVCDCANATITGTNGRDKLIGTPGDDIICGFGGDDRIFGEGGNDCLDGGDGKDVLFGGSGNDVLFGRHGNDMLRGDAGNDTLKGNADDDSLRGGEGDDILNGDSGNDDLRGDGGNDELTGGSGDDRLRGGDDDDDLQGDSGNDILRGNDGNDMLRGGTGDDIVDGDRGDDHLRGGSGDDIVRGDSGNDRLEGNGGNDSLRGGAGQDDLSGGAGQDDLIGGQDNDIIRGDGDNDVLRGSGGDDDVNGGSGDDMIRGDADDDTLRGGAGDDACDGGSGLDVANGCEATNRIP